MTDIDRVVRAWTRLGAAFAVEPLDELPDLERLLIATCRVIPQRPRLMQMAATWLGEYGRWVARSRFRHLVGTELPDEDVATLGLLLEEAELRLRDHPFREIIHDLERRLARHGSEPRPLYERQAANDRLTILAAREATESSRRWGRWMRPMSTRTDALRSPRWIIANNPTFRRRADLQGDLRCSIIETLRFDPEAGASAMELLRRCGGKSYPPVLKALGQLERSGTIDRHVEGTSKRIRLVGAFRLVAVLPVAG